MSAIRNLRHKLAFIVALLYLSQNHMSAQTNSLDSLVSGENQFALDLYARLKSADGNLFFSPYSISTCLAMAYVGARGATASQMAQTLHFDAAPDEIAMPISEQQKQLNEVRRGIELNAANGLWAQQGHPFLPLFIQAMQSNFNGSVKQVDFRTQYEPVRQEINGWASEKTKDKINDLIHPGTVDPDTRLVLVNAIYFKGSWQHPFETTNTTDAPFTLDSSRKVQAKMMHIEKRFDYGETDDLQLLKMPYSGDEPGKRKVNDGPLFMIILLPKKTNGLKKLENLLSESALRDWLATARDEKVKVFFPRFKMTTEFNLGNTLQSMGMRDAFSSAADFSGIDGSRDLFISDVIHKAHADVNEKGTEASALSSIVMSLGIEQHPIPIFRADHPFIFLIRDNQSGCILFLGRVNDPTK